LGDAQLHPLGGEASALAQFGESDDEVPDLGVLHQENRGQLLHEQPAGEKRCVGRVHLAEPGLHVLGCQDLQVPVHDPALLVVDAIEVAHKVPRLLRHLEELLFIGQLRVLPMAVLDPLPLLLFGYFLHFCGVVLQ